MTSSQKNCFMAVASLRSYTKASKQLRVSQPAVTKQIQMLERDLRITLLERDKRTVQLTENGEKFYRMIQRHDLEMNRFLDEARQNETSYSGTVRIGLPSGWNIHNLHDDLLKEFEVRFPHMRILVVVHYFADLYRLLASDEVDLILTLQPMLPLDQQIYVQGIGYVQHAAAVSNTHPLAGKEELTLQDVASEPLYVTQDDEASWLYWRNNILSEYGFEPMLSEVVNYQTQLTYIRSGRGAALIDMFCTLETGTDFRLLPLNFDEKVCLARRTENVSTEIRAVSDWVAEYFKTHNGLGEER